MAIVVEQERARTSGGLMSLLIWIVILSILGVAVYYIFFRNPASVELVLPKNTSALSKIHFNDQLITRAATLQEIPLSTAPAPQGRVNPFIGF